MDNLLKDIFKLIIEIQQITYIQVKSVAVSHGSKVPYMSAYVIMNMLYSDMSNTMGTGDDEEGIKKYLQATHDWYFDEDIGTDGEEKLFNYKMYVVK